MSDPRMKGDKQSPVKRGLPGPAFAFRRPPRITVCLVVYYAVLVAFGVIANIEDPLNGILSVLFLTHFFIPAALFAQGEVGVLFVVGVPIGIALCAVWLTGWWRILGVMGLLIGANVYSVCAAVQLGG